MSNVVRIWLIVQTNNGDNNGTKASLNLTVSAAKTIVLSTAAQQTSTNGITTPGTSAQFLWTQSNNWQGGDIPAGGIKSFTLSITGSNSDDAWLPSSIWVIYLSDTGAYSLGPQNWDWPSTNCFSTDTSDCGGTARPSWLLPWNQLNPLVEFTAGGITEDQLETSESATYQFTAKNLSPTATIASMVLGLVFDQQQFKDDGVTVGVAVGPSGYPEIHVGTSIPAGGSLPVSFAIYTNNADVRSYTFGVTLVSLSAATGSAASSQPLYVDTPHTFTVVAS